MERLNLGDETAENDSTGARCGGDFAAGQDRVASFFDNEVITGRLAD